MAQKPQEIVRLGVNLNKETAAALREISGRHGTTITETVRRAISVLKFVDDEQREGRKIQTMDQDGGKKVEFVLM